MGADQEIRLIIKSVYEGSGQKASLGDLRILVEETRKGSKEAADALDHWRQAHGKLKAQLSNTGAGLAVPVADFNKQLRDAAAPAAASDAGGGEAESGGGGRSFGARIASRLGFGFTAAAAGATAAAIAIRAAWNAIKDWNSSIERMQDNARAFDTVADHIETLQNKQRQLAHENERFALSYAMIERQVKTTSLAIQHLAAEQDIQMQFEKRAADAHLQATIAKIELDNRLAPIAKIQQEQAAREAAFNADMDRERRRAAMAIELKALEQSMAKEREAKYAAEADALAKEIPALARKADLDKGRADVVKKNSAQVIESVEAEMKIVEKFAGGTAGTGDGFAYEWFRARANEDLNPGDEDSANITSENQEFGQQAAAKRLKTLHKMLRGANLDSNRAGMVEGDSESRLALARQRRAAALGEVSGSQTEQQRAQEDEDAERRQEAIRQRYRNTIESDTIQGTRTDAERSILDATRAPAMGPQTTAVEDKLDVLIMLQRDMNRTWAV